MLKETLQKLAPGRWIGRAELVQLSTKRVLFAGFREIRVYKCDAGVRRFEIVNSARFDYRFPTVNFRSTTLTPRGEMIEQDFILRLEELRFLKSH